MSRRITVMLDEEVYKILRGLQGKKIEKQNEDVTFSAILNHVLKEAIRNSKGSDFKKTN